MRIIVVNQRSGTLKSVRFCHWLYITNPKENVELWRQNTWLDQNLNGANGAAFVKIVARMVDGDTSVFIGLCVWHILWCWLMRVRPTIS